MRKILFAAVLLGTSGCNWWYNEVPSPDQLMHVVPWFDHMIQSKAVHPYQRTDIPRNVPVGTVPVGGAEGDWRVGDPSSAFPIYGFDTLVANRTVRPTAAPAPAARSGEELYGVYCALCHGINGAGDGKVGMQMGAPPILTPLARGRSDGYLYSIIRYGRGIMPQYGDKIVRQDERWAVVDYVRTLQGAASTGGSN